MELSEAAKREYAIMVQEYINELPEKMKSIQGDWKTFLQTKEPKNFESFWVHIHQLAGSAGSFDLPKVSQHARNIEMISKEVIYGKASISDDIVSDIEKHLDKLIKVCQATSKI